VMMKKLVKISILIISLTLSGCSDNSSGPEEPEPPEKPQGTIPEVVPTDISITTPSTKISQLVGDYDRAREEPTQNKTATRYQLNATDLGVPFEDGDRTWIAFGDTWGAVGDNQNSMAYTTDANPNDGLVLDFVE